MPDTRRSRQVAHFSIVMQFWSCRPKQALNRAVLSPDCTTYIAEIAPSVLSAIPVTKQPQLAITLLNSVQSKQLDPTEITDPRYRNPAHRHDCNRYREVRRRDVLTGILDACQVISRSDIWNNIDLITGCHSIRTRVVRVYLRFLVDRWFVHSATHSSTLSQSSMTSVTTGRANAIGCVEDPTANIIVRYNAQHVACFSNIIVSVRCNHKITWTTSLEPVASISGLSWSLR